MSYQEFVYQSLENALVEGFNLPINLSEILDKPDIPQVKEDRTTSLNVVYLPDVNSPEVLSSMPKETNFLLKDDEIGDIRWQRSAPPTPIEENAYYRRIGTIGDGNCFFHVIAKALSDFYQKTYKKWRKISEEELVYFESGLCYTIKFPTCLFDQPRKCGGIYKVIDEKAMKGMMKIIRCEFVKLFRLELADKIKRDPQMQKLILKRFKGSIDMVASSIGDIEFCKRKNIGFQRVLNSLVKDLISMNPVQPDFMLILSDYLNIDIYLIRDQDLANDKSSLLYSGSSLHECVWGPADLRNNKKKENRKSLIIISVNDVHYELVGKVVENRNPNGELVREIFPLLDGHEPIVRLLFLYLQKIR